METEYKPIEYTRSDEREKVIQAIYSVLIDELAGVDYDAIEKLQGIFHARDISEVSLFAKDVFVTSVTKKDEIIALIEPNLVKWTFNRLNTYAQALLLEAVAEGKYTSYSNKAVVINEAIRFAKRYLDAKDYQYINAVLDKVL